MLSYLLSVKVKQSVGGRFWCCIKLRFWPFQDIACLRAATRRKNYAGKANSISIISGHQEASQSCRGQKATEAREYKVKELSH